MASYEYIDLTWGIADRSNGISCCALTVASTVAEPLDRLCAEARRMFPTAGVAVARDPSDTLNQVQIQFGHFSGEMSGAVQLGYWTIKQLCRSGWEPFSYGRGDQYAYAALRLKVE